MLIISCPRTGDPYSLTQHPAFRFPFPSSTSTQILWASNLWYLFDALTYGQRFVCSSIQQFPGCWPRPFAHVPMFTLCPLWVIHQLSAGCVDCSRTCCVRVCVCVRRCMCWCHQHHEIEQERQKLHYLFFHVVRYTWDSQCCFCLGRWHRMTMHFISHDDAAGVQPCHASFSHSHNDELLCQRWLSLFPLHFSYRTQQQQEQQQQERCCCCVSMQKIKFQISWCPGVPWQ